MINALIVDPVVTTWMGLLGACRKSTVDLKRWIECAMHVFSLDPLYDAVLVTLSNLQIECEKHHS